MKNKLTRVALVLALLCCTAFALKDVVVNKILAVKAKEFINRDFVKKVANSRHYIYTDGMRFDSAYYNCRSITYETLFGGHGGGNDDEYNDYVGLRTVAVSVFKSQLHKDNILAEIYDGIREDFRTLVSNQPADVRKGLIRLLTRSKDVFLKIELSDYRTEIEKDLEKEGARRVYYNYDTVCETALTKNLSPEETLKLIGTAPSVVKVEEKDPDQDVDLEKFALRRYKEGGIELIKKYRSVIALALADAKAADEKAGK